MGSIRISAKPGVMKRHISIAFFMSRLNSENTKTFITFPTGLPRGYRPGYEKRTSCNVHAHFNEQPMVENILIGTKPGVIIWHIAVTSFMMTCTAVVISQSFDTASVEF